MEAVLSLLVLLVTLTPVSSLENVALGKSASQSGTLSLQLSRYGADKAVDGDTNQDADGNSCALPYTNFADAPTRDKNGPAWWRVDLGQEFDIYQVKIYNRNVAKDSLRKTWVLVSNDDELEANNETICHDIIDGDKDIVTVSCNYKNQLYKRGRYVTLWRQAGGVHPAFLSLCEVQVLSCLVGTWGMNLPDGLADCVRKCEGSCQNGGTCRVSDGSCPSGCADGFWDKSCDQKCHCAGAAPCDIITGSCGLTGCESTYITDKDGACVTEETEEETHLHTGLVAGMATLGVLVLVLIACMVVVLFKRSNNSTRDEETVQAKRAPRSNPTVPLTSGSNQGFQTEMDELEELQQ